MKLDEHGYADELARLAVHEHGAAQNERELASLIFILRERVRNVRRVLEIGVYKGGTLWLWQTLWLQAEIVGIDDMSLMVCVDCERRRAHNDCPFLLFELNTNNTHMIRRKSADAAPHFRSETFDVLHIDGDHSHQGVRQDWNNYARVVKTGIGIILVHDIATHGAPGWGVAEFWDDTLSQLPGAVAIVRPPSEIGIGLIPR